MTWRGWLNEAASRLEEAGVPDSQVDARELMLAASGMSFTQYTLSGNENIPDEILDKLERMLVRRQSREPLQYIIGKAPFFGREFTVNPSVLIPRFDTEVLVECVLGRLKAGDKILDLCTGSGCVVISLVLEGPRGIHGFGSDISAEALKVAGANSKALLAGVEFIESDLFADIEGEFDVITANPPYIRSEEINELLPEVRDFEPRLALDGLEDGLAFYRRIAGEAPAHLRTGGILAFEIGCDEAAQVSDIMKAEGFESIEVVKDLSDLDRVVIGVRNV